MLAVEISKLGSAGVGNRESEREAEPQLPRKYQIVEQHPELDYAQLGSEDRGYDATSAPGKVEVKAKVGRAGVQGKQRVLRSQPGQLE